MRVTRIILMAAAVLLAGASPIAVAQSTDAERLVGAWQPVNYRSSQLMVQTVRN